MNTFYNYDISGWDMKTLQTFSGAQDENLKALQQMLGVQVMMRQNEIKVKLPDESMKPLVQDVFKAMEEWIASKQSLSKADVAYLVGLARKQQLKLFDPSSLSPVVKTRYGKVIYPKTLGQARLVSSIRENDIVFALGPAGTGKTYLAVAYAVQMLKQEKIKKIILTRPAVEAGESLGFLPGDLKEKVDPYLRPLYDALNEMLGTEAVARLMEKEVIEIAPLAFMRGRTLNDALVILDEAQNSTRLQMKMFLTRMGYNTKMIITGDISQIDLIKKKDSGLVQASQILQGIGGIDIVSLQAEDIVRNPLVSKIIQRYSQIDE